MKIYQEDDTSKAICPKCKDVVNTTFHYATLNHKGVEIPQILQGFCDACGDMVSLPHQSSYKIKSYQDSKQKTMKQEVRVPNEMIDILCTIGSIKHITTRVNTASRIINAYYISKLREKNSETILTHLQEFFMSDTLINRTKATSRISCLFSENDYELFTQISDKLNVSKTTLLKGFILQAKEDFLDNDEIETTKRLQEIALTLQ